MDHRLMELDPGCTLEQLPRIWEHLREIILLRARPDLDGAFQLTQVRTPIEPGGRKIQNLHCFSKNVYSLTFFRAQREEDAAKERAEKAKNQETAENNANNNTNEESDKNSQAVNGTSKNKKKNKNATTVMNGNVIRISRQRQNSSDEEESSEESESETESEETSEEAQNPEPAPPPRPRTPEDPLDVEERMLNAQLALSFTLTMTDEENIRQRMMEIKKIRCQNFEKCSILI